MCAAITDKIDEYGYVALAWLIAEVGAVELALRGVTDFSLIAELPAEMQTVAFTVIGLAGAVALLDDVELV